MSTSTMEPTALDVVKKTLKNLRRIGSQRQRDEAVLIEKQLAGMEQPAEAVSFATAEEPVRQAQGVAAATEEGRKS